MNGRERSSLEAFQRAQAFLDWHGDALATLNVSSLREELDEVVRQLEALGPAQVDTWARSRYQTAHKNKLRHLLIERYMAPIVSVVRHRADQFPLLVDLRMPDKAIGDLELVTAGLAMAYAVAKHPEVFARSTLPADAGEQLKARVTEFSQVRVSRDVTQIDATGAKMRIDMATNRGWSVIHVMQTLIKAAVGGRDPLMVGWRRAKLHAPRRTALVLQKPSVVAGALPSVAAAAPERRPRLIRVIARMLGDGKADADAA